jgi:hypothetical protein
MNQNRLLSRSSMLYWLCLFFEMMPAQLSMLLRKEVTTHRGSYTCLCHPSRWCYARLPIARAIMQSHDVSHDVSHAVLKPLVAILCSLSRCNLKGRLIDDHFQIWWTCSVAYEHNPQLHEKSAHRSFTSAIVFTTERRRTFAKTWAQTLQLLGWHRQLQSTG